MKVETKITANCCRGLDVTIVHAIVNEASRFHSSTELLYNNHFLNVKSMKNSFQFFQQPVVGEVIIICQGYDEYIALQQMTRVMERYLVGNRSFL